jgi:hypothetical protein
MLLPLLKHFARIIPKDFDFFVKFIHDNDEWAVGDKLQVNSILCRACDVENGRTDRG